jgi:hypothetical protein
MERKYRLGQSLEVRVNFAAIMFAACVMLWAFCHGCSTSPAGIYLTGGAKASRLEDAMDSGPKAHAPDLQTVIDVEYPTPPDVQVATRVDTSPPKDLATPDLVRAIDTQAADIFRQVDAGVPDAKPIAKDAGTTVKDTGTTPKDAKVFPPIPDAGLCDGGYTRWFWDGVGAWIDPECVYDAGKK